MIDSHPHRTTLRTQPGELRPIPRQLLLGLRKAETRQGEDTRIQFPRDIKRTGRTKTLSYITANINTVIPTLEPARLENETIIREAMEHHLTDTHSKHQAPLSAKFSSLAATRPMVSSDIPVDGFTTICTAGP